MAVEVIGFVFFQLDSKGVAGAVMRWGGVGSQGGWQCLGSAGNRPSLSLLRRHGCAPLCLSLQFASASLPQPECSSWPLLLHMGRASPYLGQMLLASQQFLQLQFEFEFPFLISVFSPDLPCASFFPNPQSFVPKCKVTLKTSPHWVSICQTPQCSKVTHHGLPCIGGQS